MITLPAVLLATASFTGNQAMEVVRVRLRDDPRVHSIGLGPVRMTSISHSTDVSIRARLHLLPGEKIPRSSVWVHQTSRRVTLCYDLVHDPDLQSKQRTVVLYAWVRGLRRDDPRPLEASINCGRKPSSE